MFPVATLIRGHGAFLLLAQAVGPVRKWIAHPKDGGGSTARRSSRRHDGTTARRHDSNAKPPYSSTHNGEPLHGSCPETRDTTPHSLKPQTSHDLALPPLNLRIHSPPPLSRMRLSRTVFTRPLTPHYGHPPSSILHRPSHTLNCPSPPSTPLHHYTTQRSLSSALLLTPSPHLPHSFHHILTLSDPCSLSPHPSTPQCIPPKHFPYSPLPTPHQPLTTPRPAMSYSLHPPTAPHTKQTNKRSPFLYSLPLSSSQGYLHLPCMKTHRSTRSDPKFEYSDE
jgi:hypothetical protein